MGKNKKDKRNTKYDDWYFQKALHQAKQDLLQQGYLNPLFLAYRNNEMYMFPGTFADEKEKVQFLFILKITFAVLKIEHYMVVCESWLAPSSACTCQPKDHPERKEGLLAASINYKRKRFKTFIIKRTDKIELEDFGESEGEMIGRFFDLLPPKDLVIPKEIEKSVFDLLNIEKQVIK